MSSSGRLSRCSVMQDENLVRYMHKTPSTPIKMGCQTTPRKSDKKRSLFQMSSPTNSDDLGLLSPLSASTYYSSTESLRMSPVFSPNTKLSTPPRTPTAHFSHLKTPHHSAMKFDVKSSLFPDLKLCTPKSRRSPKSQGRKSAIKKSTDANLKNGDQMMEDQTTALKSTREDAENFNQSDKDLPNSSPSSECLNQLDKDFNENVKASPKTTKLGIKPIPTDSFYGSLSEPSKVRTRLFVDTLKETNLGSRKRSLSRESITSNKSFVSGSGQRKRTSSTFSSDSKSNSSKRHKGPHVGVWHNIRKPKKMKKHVRSATAPFVLYNSSTAKMKQAESKMKTEVKHIKQLFEEKPSRRVGRSKRLFGETDSDDIIDSFPDHRIKRKKLPSKPENDKEAVFLLRNDTPDPNKKFMKYGASKRATFTLNDRVKLQISDGVMRLQSPKKKRRLYSDKKDLVVDFGDFEEPNNEIEENVKNILSHLENDDDVINHPKRELESPCKIQVTKITDAQLSDILDNPATKINLVEATPTKSVAEIHSSPNNRILRNNLSSLNLEEIEVKPENDYNLSCSNELSLGSTGNMITYMTNILCNDDQHLDAYPLPQDDSVPDEDLENFNPEYEKDSKFFSLFYKENWKKSNAMIDLTNIRSYSRRKSVKVPDDQYLLDAGQTSVGIVTCSVCGVMYQIGDFADEATHKNFHNHLNELKFNGWIGEKRINAWSDGRVIMITSGDSDSWWKKVEKIVEIVDQELGFSEASVSSLRNKTAYLFVDGNCKAQKIVGCLIAEECKTAYRMLPPLEGIDIDTCSRDPSPCKIGISRIWTALSHRRRGIAKRLIECLRRSFFFGEIVPMDSIAFSVPSPSGKSLAQKITKRLDFLVYGFST